MNVLDMRQAYHLLRGLCCVYKPRACSMEQLCAKISRNICRELAELESWSLQYNVDGVSTQSFECSDDMVGKNRFPDYSLHPYVTGGHFQPEDFLVEPLQQMDFDVAGLCPLLINDHGNMGNKIKESRQLKVYHVSGRFGRATANWSETGKIIERSTYHHVTPYKLSKVLTRLQSQFQRQAFQYSGVDVRSQEAYELACKGPLRPSEDSYPIFYGLKCIDFNKPEFTIEVQCINEDSWYLKNFVHELGLCLRTGAVYTTIVKKRHGCFSLADALLFKHWTLEHIINNISHCSRNLNSTLLRRKPLVGLEKLPAANHGLANYEEFYPAELELIPDVIPSEPTFNNVLDYVDEQLSSLLVTK